MTQTLLRRWLGATLLIGALLGGGLLGCDPQLVQAWLDEHGYANEPAAPPLRQTAPYPIVLAHGFFGFESFAGTGFLHYFYGVREALEEIGEVQVFTPTVDPFNDSETRGAQLLAAVERITQETGIAKVNLIGHSQGGLDARYVAAHRPDLVASVTTIATPHRGTPVADLMLGLLDHGPIPGLADALTRLIGAPLWDALGEETSVMISLYQLSQPGAAEFNARYADAPGVPYFSIGGRTGYAKHRDECVVSGRPGFMRHWDSARDPVGAMLLVPEEILSGGLFNRTLNDGLVPVSSMIWGRFLGCLPADHLDEIGQIAGDLPGLLNPFRHRPFYQELVQWLRSQGL